MDSKLIRKEAIPVYSLCPSKIMYQFIIIAVSGGWSSWSEWSDCSSNCGQGFQRRDRKCDNPIPRWGGPMCEGAHVDRNKCNSPCPGITFIISQNFFVKYYYSNFFT